MEKMQRRVKVAISTLSMIGNYGGLMQAVALQKTLVKMGFEPVTLHWKISIFNRGQRLIPHLCSCYRRWHMKTVCHRIPAVILRAHSYRFTAFMKRHLRTVECSFPYRSKELKSLNAEHWIVGGDQVLRYSFVPHQEIMCLAGLTREQRAKSVVYSASFGIDYWEWPEDLTERCRPLIADFKAVSLREQSGVELCRRYLGRDDAEVMPDPAFLLTEDDYDELMDEAECPPNKEYIAQYILDETPQIAAYTARLCEQKGCEVMDMATDHASYVGLWGAKRKVSHSPAMWLKLLKNANCLITDSFHGVLFAILFRVPFVCFGNHGRGNARFDMLKSMFDIKERFISPDSDIAPKAFSETEKELIARKCRDLRELGLQFLSHNLS